MSLVTGFKQRRCSVIPDGINVRTVLQEKFDYVIVAHLTGDPQWRGAVVPGNVGIGTGSKQHQQNSSMAVLCGDEQRSRAVLRNKFIFKLKRMMMTSIYLHESIDVGPGVQKFLHDAGVSALTGDEQRSAAIHRGAVHDRPGFEEDFCDVDEATLSGEEQRSRSGLTGEIVVSNLKLKS